MKKSLLSVFAVAAGLLMATSCSNEREEVKAEGEAVVTFVAEVPQSMINRAPKGLADATTFGDGTTATRLNYAVYSVGADDAWTLIDDLSKETTINLQTTVSLKLVNGKKYAVAFWADAPSSIYTFDKANYTVTANYTNAATSEESLDAFFGVKEAFVVNGASQETIELHRPFAQLNIGTADLEDAAAAGQTITAAGVTVKTYNTLNLKDGEVSGEAEISFAEAALPTAAFPVTDYKYLTMNYLLMTADKKADNTVTISYDDASGVQDRVFYNVPLQRNYRTNIYGNLLTSTTEFNVIIKPEFDGEDNNMEIWDGVTKTEPAVENDAYIVTKAAEWAWLTSKTITKNITLTQDIDFGGFTITPICPRGIVFEGNNHFLSNMNIVAPATDNYSVGLFYGTAMQGATLKNFTVKDAKVTSTNPNNGMAAVVLGDAQGSQVVTIENVHVINGEVCGVKAVAGLVGFSASGMTLNVTNCSVKNTTIKNLSVDGESGYVASLVGRVVGTANLTDCELENNTIKAFYAASRGAASIDAIAGVNSGATLNTTNVEGDDTVTITKKLVNE